MCGGLICHGNPMNSISPESWLLDAKIKHLWPCPKKLDLFSPKSTLIKSRPHGNRQKNWEIQQFLWTKPELLWLKPATRFVSNAVLADRSGEPAMTASVWSMNPRDWPSSLQHTWLLGLNITDHSQTFSYFLDIKELLKVYKFGNQYVKISKTPTRYTTSKHNQPCA